MPTLICDHEHVSHYRNTRGSRIADMRCPECGGVVHRAVFLDGRYQRLRQNSAKSLGAFATCAVCGKRRRQNGSNARTAEVDSMTLTVTGELLPVSANSTVCWCHELFPSSCLGDYGRARPHEAYTYRPECDIVAVWESRYGTKALLKYPAGWHQWHDREGLAEISAAPPVFSYVERDPSDPCRITLCDPRESPNA